MNSESEAESNETTNLDSVKIPISNLISAETRGVLQQESDRVKARGDMQTACPSIDEKAKLDDLPAIRQCHAEYFHAKDPYLFSQKSRYSVSVRTELIADVYTEIFTPEEGISQDNQKRVLINLHGGGFTGGSRTASHLESIPIADIGRIKVVSVDYRMAPEHQFPAASQDVAAVYKELLKEYKPENIGIYGCSAGGLLTAESMAWFQNKSLPLPAAIGMFCGAAYFWMDGISGHIQATIQGFDLDSMGIHKTLYFKDLENFENPLAFPGAQPAVMANFPPSLLITSTHDYSLSSVVKTHSQLVKLGVESDLHVWEGVNHGFIFNSDLPESREAYDVIVAFFNKHLGG